MRARIATGVILFLGAAGMVAGARAAEGYTPPGKDAFLKSIHDYPFVADAGRRARVRAAVPQLARCMPSTQVRKLLGDPDFGYVAYQAGTDGKVPQMRIWHYVLEKKAATEEVPGSRVVVWFDNSGKLNAVTVHGAPDIEATVSRRAGRCD